MSATALTRFIELLERHCVKENVALKRYSILQVWRMDPFHWEKVRKPRKFMKNPPAFDSPVMEPNVLTADYAANMPIEKVSVAIKK